MDVLKNPLPGRCKAECMDNSNPRWPRWVQCRNKDTKDGYCGIHHPDAVTKREAKQKDRQQRETAHYDAIHVARVADAKRLQLFPELVQRLIEIRDVQPIQALEQSEYWIKVQKLLNEVPK